MAALGLSYGQFAIATNVYAIKYEFNYPAPERWELVHQVSLSTVWPVKILGYNRFSVSGTVQVLGSALHVTIADILTATSERKLSFMAGGIEVYCYAKGGSVGLWGPKIRALAGASDYFLVPFSFGSTRTKLYKASDDSVLWGS